MDTTGNMDTACRGTMATTDTTDTIVTDLTSVDPQVKKLNETHAGHLGAQLALLFFSVLAAMTRQLFVDDDLGAFPKDFDKYFGEDWAKYMDTDYKKDFGEEFHENFRKRFSEPDKVLVLLLCGIFVSKHFPPLEAFLFTLSCLSLCCLPDSPIVLQTMFALMIIAIFFSATKVFYQPISAEAFERGTKAEWKKLKKNRLITLSISAVFAPLVAGIDFAFAVAVVRGKPLHAFDVVVSCVILLEMCVPSNPHALDNLYDI